MSDHLTTGPDAQPHDEVLDRAECLALLASHEVGRLGVVDGAQPLIFPVNYRLDEDTIVFRTDPGNKLYSAPLNRVAFEIDGIDSGARTGWSVLVQGVAAEITTAIDPRSEHMRTLPVEPWARGPRSHWVRVVPRVVSGRRVRAQLKEHT